MFGVHDLRFLPVDFKRLCAVLKRDAAHGVVYVRTERDLPPGLSAELMEVEMRQRRERVAAITRVAAIFNLPVITDQMLWGGVGRRDAAERDVARLVPADHGITAEGKLKYTVEQTAEVVEIVRHLKGIYPDLERVTKVGWTTRVRRETHTGGEADFDKALDWVTGMLAATGVRLEKHYVAPSYTVAGDCCCPYLVNVKEVEAPLRPLVNLDEAVLVLSDEVTCEGVKQVVEQQFEPLLATADVEDKLCHAQHLTQSHRKADDKVSVSQVEELFRRLTAHGASIVRWYLYGGPSVPVEQCVAHCG